MQRSTWWTLSLVVGFGVLFSLASAGFAREDENSDRSNRSSNDQASQDESSSRDRGSSEENAQHHAVLGVSLAEQNGRVRVIAVMPGSPAAKAGIEPGDEIRRVNDERVRSAHDLAEEIEEQKPGSKVELTIRRSNGESETVRAKLVSHQQLQGSRNNRGWNQQSENGQQYGQQGQYGQQQGQYNRGQQGQGQYASNEQFEGRQNWQANRGRSAYSYQPGDEQQLDQQIRQLQQQVARLQQQVNELQQNQGNRNQGQNR